MFKVKQYFDFLLQRLIQTELERDRDQGKFACMILCGRFHTTTSAVSVPVPIIWH